MTYTEPTKKGSVVYSVRGFVAAGDICGDLELYSDKPLSPDDPQIKLILSSFHLVEAYVPQFIDAFIYATKLFQTGKFKEAAPMFEQALAKLTSDGSPFPSLATARRVTTDQAGMAYGMSGQIPKARDIFEKAVAEDAGYPMYFYNLACADAEEHKLADARRHLEQAFARKANRIPGEPLPDPTKDDSFLPYKGNKEFWKFLEGIDQLVKP